jgi:hypothetical protein
VGQHCDSQVLETGSNFVLVNVIASGLEIEMGWDCGLFYNQ